MGATKDQTLTVHTRRNYKNKEKKENHHHNKNKDKKQRISRETLPMFDAILVMKRDTLQHIVSSGKRDTMCMLSKTMNQQTKDSKERRVSHMKCMC